MPTSFQNALKQSQVAPILDSIELSGIFTEAADSIKDIQQLRAYQGYLRAMRERKVSTKATSFPLESSVLTQARLARDAGRRAIGNFLKSIQQLRQSDFVPEVIRAVEMTGEIDPAAELSAVIQDQQVRQRLQEAGISIDLLNEAVAIFKQANLKISAANGEVTVTTADERKTELYLGDERAFRLDGEPSQISPSQLLRQPLFDIVVDGFANGTLPGALPINLDLISRQQVKRVELYEAYALSSLAVVTELERHVRKLECGGAVDTHRGNSDPVSWILGLIIGGLAVTFIGGLILAGCGSDETWCDIGYVFIALGLGAFGSGVIMMGPGFVPLGVLIYAGSAAAWFQIPD